MHTNFDLARLIQPVTPEAFIGEYYERQPLRVSRNDPDYFDGLLTLAQLDSVLSVASVREPDLRVVNAGTAIGINELSPVGPGSASGKLELLYAQFREGATIGLQALQERWQPLKQLSRALAVDLSARIQTNVYLTPSNGTGLRLHYDTHDVFVLQTVGRKRWQLFGMGATLPGRSQPYQPGVDPGEPEQEFILEQGDSLYIPRGCLHQAFGCEQELSVHITVGVHPVTWSSLIKGAINSLIEEEPAFRQALPAGFAYDPLLRARAEQDAAEMIDRLTTLLEPASLISNATHIARSGRPTGLDGHLLDLAQVSNLAADSRIRIRDGLHHRIESADDDGILQVFFHGKSIQFPPGLDEALMFIFRDPAAGDGFSADDLPGPLNIKERLVLLRRLIREGALTFCH